MPDGSRTYLAANKAETAEQARRCYELKLAGWSHDKIAEELKVSHGTVANRIKAHIEVRVPPLADELRAVMVDRLDLCIEKLHEQIQDPETAGRLARNVGVLVKVEERRAKLLGFDAPERIEATVTEVTREDGTAGAGSWQRSLTPRRRLRCISRRSSEWSQVHILLRPP